MRTIVLENWPRRAHYELYRKYDYPHVAITGHLEIAPFLAYQRERQLPFFLSILYAVVHTAQNIPEFRYRIRGETVIEHDLLYPSFTVLQPSEVFSFCTVPFDEDYQAFIVAGHRAIQHAQQHVQLEDEPGKDDYLFITSMPWVSFTSLQHPIQMHPVDSIPRIAWGRYFEHYNGIRLPVAVQAHHALVDGLHIGQFYQRLQALLERPEKTFPAG